MKPVSSLILSLSLATGVLGGGVMSSSGQAEEKKPTSAAAEASQEGAAPELTDVEQAFIESMSGTVLEGYFTLAGEKTDPAGKPERYEIREISKVKDQMWIFQTRVKYGKVDTVLPILLPIEWAGDTPVVSMTNFTIPGMGTFSCRVLFHEDRYAGTWQHGEKGGHLWGTIKKQKP